MDHQEGLSPKAYEIIDGNEYPPIVPPEQNIAEFTLKAVLVGAVIGAVFGAANAYLGLKVGLTVSASIPAAVMAVAFFKIIGKGSILETNTVQTIGSAGESLAAGVIFTIPAFFLWGLSPSQVEIMFVSIAGGMLGVLFMIPLRKFLIVKEHGNLPYPEGTACAEVLVAGQGDPSKAKMLFAGMGLGGLYQFLMNSETFALWSASPHLQIQNYITRFKGAVLGAEVTPELLGVGYIIGPRISAIMLSGGLLGWFVMIPMIVMFGEHISVPIYPETTTPLSEMGAGAIWSKYVRYVGAGGVAFAGIFSLVKSIPVIMQSFVAGIQGLGAATGPEEKRTQRDLPFTWILGGSLVLAVAIAVYLGNTVFASKGMIAIIAAVLIVIFSFFFVTVSSRIVGLLGSSSNPISGMTIATLILTCLLFIFFGLGEMENVKVAVLTVGAFVCIAAAIAGDTSQDLKTGFLVGATPRRQQMGEFIGVIVSGLSMGFVMYVLKDGIISKEFAAPQATLMKIVVDGVIGDSLPWNLVIAGMFVALFVEMLGVNSLAFAVGLYLPMSLSVPIMVGGLIRMWVDSSKGSDVDERRESGVLYSSGMIAGAALVGLVITGSLGIRDSFSPISMMSQAMKRPGIVLKQETEGKFYANGTEVKKFVSQSYKDFSDEKEGKAIEIKFSGPGGEFVKNLEQHRWDRNYVYATKEGIEVQSHHKKVDFYALIAFSLLTLSLMLSVRRKS